MQTWKCIFDSTTLIGTGCNREPGQGEIARDIDTAQCAWFNVYPERYKLDSLGFLVERPEWAAEKAFNEQKIADEKTARDLYEIEAEAPVEALGYTWNGGQDSASYIQGAVGLAQALGEEDVTITDIDNVSHTMSFSDAMTIAALIGAQFRVAFFKKQNTLVEIANRVLNA